MAPPNVGGPLLRMLRVTRFRCLRTYGRLMPRVAPVHIVCMFHAGRRRSGREDASIPMLYGLNNVLQLLCGLASNWLQIFIVDDRKYRISINHSHLGSATSYTDGDIARQ